MNDDLAADQPVYARADKGRIWHVRLLSDRAAFCGARPRGGWASTFPIASNRATATGKKFCAQCDRLRQQGVKVRP
jgi:hypothetical protein